jgi:hypothetical protein
MQTRETSSTQFSGLAIHPDEERAGAIVTTAQV